MVDLPEISVNWGEFFVATNNAVQTAAIVVGGGWAYRKYVHNRANYASLLLEVAASVTEVEKRRSMHVATKITNSGTYHMKFGIRCQQRVVVHCMDRSVWSDACIEPQVDWSKAKAVGFDQLVDSNKIRDVTKSLEPSESVSHSWLVPLPEGDWVAYRVRFRVLASKLTWGRESKPLGWTTTQILVTS